MPRVTGGHQGRDAIYPNRRLQGDEIEGELLFFRKNRTQAKRKGEKVEKDCMWFKNRPKSRQLGDVMRMFGALVRQCTAEHSISKGHWSEKKANQASQGATGTRKVTSMAVFLPFPVSKTVVC